VGESKMKIPKNMTEQETMHIIQTVINRIAPRYTFNGYEVDDIKQEAFIICVDALNRYDNCRPLENFLSVNLSNRLKNFVRDNFGNAKDLEKKKVLSPISFFHDTNCNSQYYEMDIEEIDQKQLMQLVEAHLPISMREDFLKLINGMNLVSTKREALIKKIKDIINEKG
jgi:DNA-directed RNA polymerase specialized sigma24 family protein